MATDSIPLNDPLLDALWDRGLILIGERVREEYALNTPYFVDLRHKLYDDLDLFEALGTAIAAKVANIVGPTNIPQQITGIPDTATPLALAAASASRRGDLRLTYGQLRKQRADYPGGRAGSSPYMGVVDPSREITLLDDVMASGRTKLQCIDQLGKVGMRVARILVVVDREQGGTQILEQQGTPVFSIYTASETIRYYLSTGRITEAESVAAIEFLRRKQYS